MEPHLEAFLNGDPLAQFVLIQQPGRFVVARRVGPDHVQPVHDPLELRRAVAAQGIPTAQIATHIAHWKDTTPAFEEPSVIALPHEPGLAWSRLPFPLPPHVGPQAWPAWNEFVSRLSDPAFYLAWLGSVFDKGNRSRQILWLYGDGQDGKSTTFRVLYETLGSCMATVPDVGMGEDAKRFLAFQAYGHRLVVVTDCRNLKILRAGIIRNLTSGDLVSVEGKGTNGFTAVTWTKLAVCSNDRPDISSGRADTSRAVVLRVAESVSKSDAQWEDRLRREVPAFLSSCLQRYREVCPGRAEIPCAQETQQATKDAASESEAETEVIADDLVLVGRGRSCSLGALRILARQNHRLSRFECDDLVRWLKVNRGVVQKGTELVGCSLKGGQGKLL